MTWQGYIIPVVASTSLMAVCWCVGHYGFSPMWIVFFAALYVLKTHVCLKAEQRRMRLRDMILSERQAILAHYNTIDDLPAWVQFPDTERIEWVNKIIEQLWPYIGEYTGRFLREFIEPQVKSQMPSPFKSFKFVAIDCGDIPCRVGGLKVYTHKNNVGRDKVIVDMDVAYAGDSDFTVQTCGFKGGMNQIVLSGKVRCVLEPLLPYPPMFGAISASFMELPRFDFNLTGMGEFVQLPGLIDAIKSIINGQMASLAVLPNKIVLPLVPNIDLTRLYCPEPEGVIRLKILDARNLENKDISILLKKDKSDPYCEIQVGSQIFRTRTINNNLSPVFNECFEAVVDEASGQKLRIELFDEDTAGADEELGRLTLDLAAVKKAGELEGMYHLEACKHGDLRLRVSWLNLSSDLRHLEQVSWENEWLTSDKPIHPALLMVFIDSVTDLPFPKINLEPSPFVEVTLAGASQRTPVKPKSMNPIYQTKFIYFLKQPEGKELHFKAVDDGTRRELGELSIPLAVIMKEPGMQLFQQTFYLAQGVHTSPIVLTIRLRALVPPTLPVLAQSAPSVYGNASYIERADKPDEQLSNGVAVLCPEPSKAVDDQRIRELAPEGGLSTERVMRPRSSSSLTGSSSIAPSHGRGFIKRLKTAKTARKERQAHEPLGSIQLSLRYDEEKFKLIADVGSAKNLLAISEEGTADPYVKVSLKPVANGSLAKSKGKKRTTPVKNTLNPQFDASFDFDVHFTELQYYRLIVAVKDNKNYGVMTVPPSLGRMVIPLANFDPKRVLVNEWFNLEPDGDKH